MVLETVEENTGLIPAQNLKLGVSMGIPDRVDLLDYVSASKSALFPFVLLMARRNGANIGAMGGDQGHVLDCRMNFIP
jgi:hypothetical protein